MRLHTAKGRERRRAHQATFHEALQAGILSHHRVVNAYDEESHHEREGGEAKGCRVTFQGVRGWKILSLRRYQFLRWLLRCEQSQGEGHRGPEHGGDEAFNHLENVKERNVYYTSLCTYITKRMMHFRCLFVSTGV